MIEVQTVGQVLKAQSRAAQRLHPYSVTEAEAVEYGWLDEGRRVALDEVRRCQWLLNGDPLGELA